MEQRTLNLSIYVEECLALTARHFEAVCVGTWTVTKDTVCLRLEPQPDAPPETLDEFLNHLLVASIETRLT
jgi:hypothetical protein